MPSISVLKHLCVFCGSSGGNRPQYRLAATALGRLLVERNLELVYGGGHTGLMGVIADAVLSAGGRVTGVMPRSLIEREVGHKGLSQMHVVGSMHERKALMADLADGFIALPGGHGTLDEFCEMLTWAQLGIHTKPCGILNVEGYFDTLLALFDHAVEEGFLKPVHRDMIIVDTSAAGLLRRMEEAPVVLAAKWIPSEAQRSVP